MQKLEIQSNEDNSCHQQLESPNHLNTHLKKRTFRQVLKHNIDDMFSQNEFESKHSYSSDKKSLKFNEKMLRKATATVDLISQKAKKKNLIQDVATASFITNGIELTQDAFKKIQGKGEFQYLIEGEETGMSLRFIKPSKTFYNNQMSNWLIFSVLLKEHRNSSSQLSQTGIRKSFYNYSVGTMKKKGQWKDYYMKSVDKFADILSREFCDLKKNMTEDEEDISIFAFFDNVKA
mmetsp:Transcript_35806/g.34840  ORF Transcript_35806/g.34840 Transcript_35806/m.34840 type:complete len:234 (+) Transcript_35806:1320-2021(+)|eukprot:CAMPEP_0170556396 /NCGR_PEP_ID=MMETSP0211-20121228/16618_1 /TAXON_ID=311385 /ORGANISM="Pseudokeronopsis sp., Strain OXSARD2" /LENGTH=233 /DNA_ID=CAMNT_0010866709 /DNA_START=1304 /DNA_END=2005 /DNA_ORIENTATION=-